jgi:hypothetical protein
MRRYGVHMCSRIHLLRGLLGLGGATRCATFGGLLDDSSGLALQTQLLEHVHVLGGGKEEEKRRGGNS